VRMNRFFVGLLVLALTVGLTGIAALAASGNGNKKTDSVSDTVSWTVQKYVELSINDSAYDFGAIDPSQDTITATNANVLTVTSNTSWVLTYSVSGNGGGHLSVGLESSQGQGDAAVNVSYTLSNLHSMAPGNYTATVTYTVTAS
jgi:spore coat protein U-like protein